MGPRCRRRFGLPLCLSPLGRSLSVCRTRKPIQKSTKGSHPEASRRSKAPFPSPLPPSVSFDCDSDDQHEEVDTVQADFGFFDPKPGDFHGVKALLSGYLDVEPWDLSGFVDIILQQTTVGTVVKSESSGGDEGSDDGDDNDIFAMASVLNLARYKGHACMAELRKYILRVCNDKGAKKKLQLLFEEQARNIGLLVSQRFVNCPLQLVPPLYDGLFDEVAWATEDEPTEELQSYFKLKYYLIISKIYVKKNSDKCKANNEQDSDEAVIYIKPEDEIFHKLSLFSYTYNLRGIQRIPCELSSYSEMRIVMLIDAKQIPKFRKELKAFFVDS